jgi:hypothetical protein
LDHFFLRVMWMVFFFGRGESFFFGG